MSAESATREEEKARELQYLLAVVKAVILVYFLFWLDLRVSAGIDQYSRSRL
jgi:hypothetical protein